MNNKGDFFGKDKIKDSPVQLIAKKLGNALRANRLSTKGVDNGYQCHLLYELVKKQPAKEVNLVVDWFIKNCKNPVLKVSSVQGFIKRYPQIKAYFEKACPKDSYITPLAKKLAESGDQYSWPMGSEDQIPLMAQMSLDNWIPFLKRFDKNCKKLSHNLKGLLDYTSDNWADSDIEFITEWIQWVNTVINDWDDWDGNLRHFAWKHDHWLFKKFGRKWTDDYGVDISLWDKLIEELNK